MYDYTMADDKVDFKQGAKHDDGKPMFSCLPPLGMLELGKIEALGVKKYGRHNYRQGINVSRLIDASFRHLLAAMNNEDYDPIDGNNHLASVAWNCLVAIQTINEKPEFDDRYKDNK